MATATPSVQQLSNQQAVVSIGNLSLNLDNYRVSIGGDIIDLTYHEIELLHIFVENADRVVSYETLARAIWGNAERVSTRHLNVLVHRLRSKLAGSNPSGSRRCAVGATACSKHREWRTAMSGNTAPAFCVECGLNLEAWQFCPRCGAKRIEIDAPEPAAPAPPSRATAMRLEVRQLIDDGNLAEAEVLVRRELEVERTLETLLVAADVLSRRHVVNETKDLLDEALELAPKNYLVHVRLSEHFGRIGLYPQSLEAIVKARRLLPPKDVSALLYCQELERIMRDRSRGSFVRETGRPKLPRFRGARKDAAQLANSR